MEDEIYFCDRLFWVLFYSLIYLDKQGHVLFNVKIRTPLYGWDGLDHGVIGEILWCAATNEARHSKL